MVSVPFRPEALTHVWPPAAVPLLQPLPCPLAAACVSACVRLPRFIWGGGGHTGRTLVLFRERLVGGHWHHGVVVIRYSFGVFLNACRWLWFIDLMSEVVDRSVCLPDVLLFTFYSLIATRFERVDRSSFLLTDELTIFYSVLTERFLAGRSDWTVAPLILFPVLCFSARGRQTARMASLTNFLRILEGQLLWLNGK